MRAKISFPCAFLISACVAAGLGIAVRAIAAAEDESGPEMLEFRAQLENHDPPNEAQVKTLLEGARARQHSDRIWAITEARLKTFRTNGEPEMLAAAPFCLYDTTRQTVSSSGPVQIQSADQVFLLEGRGFLLRQTNSTLSISNQVHTRISNPVHTAMRSTSAKSNKP